MKSTRLVVITIISIFFVVTILSLLTRYNRPEPVPGRFTEQAIGQLKAFYPSTLYVNQTAPLFLNLQGDSLPANDCQATVYLTSPSKTIQMQTGGNFTNQATIVVDKQNTFLASIDVRPLSSSENNSNTTLEISSVLTCAGADPVVNYQVIDFSVETKSSPFIRFLSEYMSDPGMFTGLSGLVISIVALWVTTLLESEKKRSERKAKLEAIDQEIHNDFGRAVLQIVELEKDKKRWDSDQQAELDRLRKSCESREPLMAFLRQIGKILESEDDQQIKDFFTNAETSYWDEFCKGGTESSSSASRTIFCKGIHAIVSLYKNKRFSDEELKSIFRLWDEFDIYSAGVVVYALNQLRSKEGAHALNPKEQLESTPHRKRLIRYKSLEWMIREFNLTLPGEYTWPTTPGKPVQPEIDPDVKAWLERPFDNKVLAQDPFSIELVDDTWCEPENWAQVKSFNSASFWVNDPRDRDLIINRLWFELRQAEKSSHAGAFSVYLPLYSDQLPASDVIAGIAHWVAEAWIRFIVQNPGAFLDLTPIERHALAAYLQWQAGSAQALILRLRYLGKNLADAGDAQKQTEFNLVIDLLSAESAVYPQGIAPSSDQLLEWLQIRPPWLEVTFLILVYRDQPGADWLQALQRAQAALQKSNVISKEFSQDWPASATAIRLEWNEPNLIEMLGNRVSWTGSGRDTLTGLFIRPAFPDGLAADRRLAAGAHGSLSGMLDLGERTLLNHARNHPDDPELWPDDLADNLL